MRKLKMVTLNYNNVQIEVEDFDAEPSSRLLPYTKNYHEVNEGEEFDFEMVATTVTKDGVEVKLSFIFTDIKGDEKDLDQFDYTYPDSIEEI